MDETSDGDLADEPEDKLKRDLEAQLREGYIATRAERQELNEDWSILDGEGWPE